VEHKLSIRPSERARNFMVLWSIVSSLYAIALLNRVLHHVHLGLPTLSAIAALAAVWLYLLDSPSTGSASEPRWSRRRVGALGLVGLVVAINSVLVARAIHGRQPVPPERGASTIVLVLAALLLWREARRPYAHHNSGASDRVGFTPKDSDHQID
jgi:hypothetical protein